MYTFVDTTEVPDDSALPSEALSINGTYIENEISGYRTLKVEGRESLESEVSTSEVGMMNGEYYHGKRDLSRTITVTYQMLSDNPEDFRSKFNKLCGMLDFEQAQLTFADEIDKYYIGTKTEMESPEAGRLNVVSTFSIYCDDPYKYSVTEKMSSNNGSKTITLVNSGTKPIPISISAKMQSDNGFLGYVLEDRFFQIGNPGEVDGNSYEMTELLFDDHMNQARGWTVNQGVTPPVTPTRDMIGTIGYIAESADEGYAYVSDYKTGNSWHGASLMKTVPTDENLEYPVNWKSSYRFDFNTDGSSNPNPEIGHNSMTYSDENDNIIVSVVIEDNNPTYEKSDLYIYVEGQRVLAMKNTDQFYDTLRGSSHAVDIEKIGNQVNIRYGKKGINKTYLLNNPNAQLRKMTWYGAAYQTYAHIRNNFFRAANLYKHNVDKYEDIPNYFASGDTVDINSDGEVYVNDTYNMDMVDIGSQTLILPPGQHTLGIITSSFALVPDVKVTWKEKWI